MTKFNVNKINSFCRRYSKVLRFERFEVTYSDYYTTEQKNKKKNADAIQ